MKIEQQQQAQRLYFQSGLNKTEIAETLGISRRSLHNWIRENHWEQIRKNAENIPCFLAENCYQVLGNLTGSLLSADRIGQPATMQEVNAIYKLTLTISKLKKQSTLNESMETLAWFMESVNEKAPELAQQIQPHVDEYITTHAAKSTTQYRQSQIAAIDKNTDQNIAKAEAEAILDMEDIIAWANQENVNPAAHPEPAKPPVKTGSNKSIREMLRGTATTGPSKVLRRHQPVAA